MADVPATEEAVAAEFAIGGAAASFCGQWLCVKAGFEKKDGVVFLRDALGTKAPSDDVLKAVGDETTPHQPARSCFCFYGNVAFSGV